jgi:periplasmic divalent cation tolerance protein
MTTVYVTSPPDAADEIVEALLEDRLAACVNRVPSTSTYRWEGEVHRNEEAILLVKTTEEAYEELVDRVRAIHPHDVPCIERFDEDDVVGPFAAWLDSSVY